MPVMKWNESLMLDQNVMDETHEEFVELLNGLADAPDEKVLALYMKEKGFEPDRDPLPVIANPS